MKYRTESDSMGTIKVPSDALYGAQTQRAVDNFTLSNTPLPASFIRAIAHIKKAAAQANSELELLDSKMAGAIVDACDQLIAGEHSDQFPVDVFQTGSGTSTNMNVNEVLAHLASEALGQPIGANDHVNMSQSSNDVIPTAIHVSAALAIQNQLQPALEHLHGTLLGKAEQLQEVVKTGRTHLMDAMPVTMGQELRGWASQIAGNHHRLEHSLGQLAQVAQGGTAVGTGINAHPEFAGLFAEKLSENAGLEFVTSDNFFAAIGSQDVAVSTSGQLKTLAASLMKMANDLRWMNSGPLAGLGEIELEALQPGSSIMPGKVNPVIPEAVAMASAQVMGNDTTITVAGQSGNFELNVMLPLVAHNLLNSIELMSNACRALADKAIASFRVRQDNLNHALARNPILVTALNPIIGYEKAAAIAKRAYAESRPIIDVADEETDLGLEELQRLLDPQKLTNGGLPG
ncbi:aspartate ammonia-lyase [Marinimicrobium sp. ABcell2]|uniref:class II fumarate hydratase n=1 Tax=Marinimicrobium sp. ABcell2 TaxID=3069751 RepID=UPI0027B6287B|nr:class II fumarate hydratase [Marinimicrobium sp. ABcell2]MDQ2078364.1 class II fumarate hydratase [Marinimicrobium sp. ABcell2]